MCAAKKSIVQGESADTHNATPSNVTFFRRVLLRWYSEHGRSFPWRNASATNYHKIVAEVLLQRTRAEAAAKLFWPFVAKYPSWRRLSRASEEDLRDILQPLGLWRRRARTLNRLSKAVANRGRFPKNRHAIEAVPGIGQYIANAIMLFVNKQPAPLLDVNMARVLERFFGPRKLVDIRYDPYLQVLANRVINSNKAVAVNWAILDLAAIICTIRNPACVACPLRNRCKTAREAE